MSLIAALRRASFRIVTGGGKNMRVLERDWFDPDDLQRALYISVDTGGFDAETCLAAWAVLKAFRGEFPTSTG